MPTDTEKMPTAARGLPRSAEYKSGYAKGYHTAHRWPMHKPPLPPDDVLRGIIEAARRLRDGVDTYLATIPEDDPLNDELGPHIDALDKELERTGEWLLTEE